MTNVVAPSTMTNTLYVSLQMSTSAWSMKMRSPNYLSASQISGSSGEEVSSFCNAHSLGLLLCTGHELLQADASWMFGVETEQATYDNV